MKILDTPKNNKLQFTSKNFKVNSFKVADKFLADEPQIDLRTMSTNAIVNMLEANMKKRESLLENSELGKQLQR